MAFNCISLESQGFDLQITMAKIEISGNPLELGRISEFLKQNHIVFKIVDDYGNHTPEELDDYKALMMKFNH